MCESYRNEGEIKQKRQQKDNPGTLGKVGRRRGVRPARAGIGQEVPSRDPGGAKHPNQNRCAPLEPLCSPSRRCGNVADCLASRRRTPYEKTSSSLATRLLPPSNTRARRPTRPQILDKRLGSSARTNTKNKMRCVPRHTPPHRFGLGSRASYYTVSNASLLHPSIPWSSLPHV